MNASTPLPTTDDEPNAPLLELIDESGVYVSIGDVVAGKYRVEQVLGIGGMAFVLSAKHVELDERFALKFLAQRFLGEPALVERFMHEARAACRLRSEHIARVYDVGIHEGAPFIVMEHLQGRDLSTVVYEGGPLRLTDAVEYAMQACEALATAHRHGIVHRDIKPENLFLVEHEGLPSIKLLDFGISKIALAGGESSSRLTGDLTLGTPCYMAPEQIRSSASADARSDMWSLGVVLYELLAGTEAFRAPSITEVCAAVLERQPQPLEELRPDVPPELAKIVARCLEKAPGDRFLNVAELAAGLLPFAPTRALVSAERSSSLMRVATPIEDVRISSVRPAVQLRSSREDESPPSSSAPVARRTTDAAAASKWKGRGALAALFALCAAGAVVGWRRIEQVERSARTATITAENAAEAPTARDTATTPLAIRPSSVANQPSAIREPVVTTKRPASPAVAKHRPPAVSVSVSASTEIPTPASAPTVELGY